jgi:hypothetical protein
MPVWCGRVERTLDLAGGGRRHRVWRNGVEQEYRPADPALPFGPQEWDWGTGVVGNSGLGSVLLDDCLKGYPKDGPLMEAFDTEIVSRLGDVWVLTGEDIQAWFAVGPRTLII